MSVGDPCLYCHFIAGHAPTCVVFGTSNTLDSALWIRQQLAAAQAEATSLRAALAAERGRTWEAWLQWYYEADNYERAWTGRNEARVERDAARADLARLAGYARELLASLSPPAEDWHPGLWAMLDALPPEPAAEPTPTEPPLPTRAEAQERYRLAERAAREDLCRTLEAIRVRGGGTEDPVKAWDEWFAASRPTPAEPPVPAPVAEVGPCAQGRAPGKLHCPRCRDERNDGSVWPRPVHCLLPLAACWRVRDAAQAPRVRRARGRARGRGRAGVLVLLRRRQDCDAHRRN